MPTGARDAPFVPALIVVDVQEDFCPPVSRSPRAPHITPHSSAFYPSTPYRTASPATNVRLSITNNAPNKNGALAVPDGRCVVAPINALLRQPFALKAATKDFHPPSHVSFASNHAPPDNVPFASTVIIVNPLNASETYSSRLWPPHCVQGTPGAELLPDLDAAALDAVVEKGQDDRVEMYSAFADPFRAPCVAQSALEELLKQRGVTDVFVTGLAMDYCVRYTAEDAVERGWRTWVIEEATKAVDADKWDHVKQEMEAKGVRFASVDGEEVGRVKTLAGKDKIV